MNLYTVKHAHTYFIAHHVTCI